MKTKQFKNDIKSLLHKYECYESQSISEFFNSEQTIADCKKRNLQRKIHTEIISDLQLVLFDLNEKKNA